MICVDPTFSWPGKGQWCHLFEDEGDVEALHEFAARIGLWRDWFQDHRSLPHYDLRPCKRRRAVQAGAREVGLKETALAIRRCRDRQSEHVAAEVAGEFD